jgi:hypothetical protein
MRRPLAPHPGGIHVPRSRPMSSVSFHREPISARPALPFRPRRAVTAEPRFRAARTFATIAAMTPHWNAARPQRFNSRCFFASGSISGAAKFPGSEYCTAESSSEMSSDAPRDRGTPRSRRTSAFGADKRDGRGG